MYTNFFKNINIYLKETMVPSTRNTNKINNFKNIFLRSDFVSSKRKVGCTLLVLFFKVIAHLLVLNNIDI